MCYSARGLSSHVPRGVVASNQRPAQTPKNAWCYNIPGTSQYPAPTPKPCLVMQNLNAQPRHHTETMFFFVTRSILTLCPNTKSAFGAAASLRLARNTKQLSLVLQYLNARPKTPISAWCCSISTPKPIHKKTTWCCGTYLNPSPKHQTVLAWCCSIYISTRHPNTIKCFWRGSISTPPAQALKKLFSAKSMFGTAASQRVAQTSNRVFGGATGTSTPCPEHQKTFLLLQHLNAPARRRSKHMLRGLQHISRGVLVCDLHY